MYSHFDSTNWVTPFGLIFLGAIFTAWFFARRNATSISLDPSHVDLLIPVAIIVGVTGGTVVAMLTSMDDGIRVHLFSVVGAGAFAIFVYSRIARLSFRRLLDVFALPTLAALMVHRLGCFMAGCCWGKPVGGEQPVGGGLPATIVQYPPGSHAYEQHLAMDLIEPGALASLPVHPVQLYEAGMLLVLLLLLWRMPWQRLQKGTVAIATVCSYALLRFFVEYLRADGAIILGNLTVTQLQCIVLMFSAVLLPRARKVY